MEDGQTEEKAIQNTINTGKKYGAGLGGESDSKSTYDNFMILRGALFASQRFTAIRTPTTEILEHGVKVQSYEVHLKTTYGISNSLGNSISKSKADKYGY